MAICWTSCLHGWWRSRACGEAWGSWGGVPRGAHAHGSPPPPPRLPRPPCPPRTTHTSIPFLPPPPPPCRELALHGNLLTGDLPAQLTCLSLLQRLSCCDLDLFNSADTLRALGSNLTAVWVAADRAGFQLPTSRQVTRVLCTLRDMPALREFYCSSRSMRAMLNKWRAEPLPVEDATGTCALAIADARAVLGGVEPQQPPHSPSAREREWACTVWRMAELDWPYCSWPLPEWDGATH